MARSKRRRSAWARPTLFYRERSCLRHVGLQLSALRGAADSDVFPEGLLDCSCSPSSFEGFPGAQVPGSSPHQTSFSTASLPRNDAVGTLFKGLVRGM